MFLQNLPSRLHGSNLSLPTCKRTWDARDPLGHQLWGLDFTSTYMALQSPAETAGSSALTAGNPISAGPYPVAPLPTLSFGLTCSSPTTPTSASVPWLGRPAGPSPSFRGVFQPSLGMRLEKPGVAGAGAAERENTAASLMGREEMYANVFRKEAGDANRLVSPLRKHQE